MTSKAKISAVVVSALLLAGPIVLAPAQARHDGFEYAQGQIAVLEIEEHAKGEGVRIYVQLKGLENHIFKLDSRLSSTLLPLTVALEKDLFVRFRVHAQKNVRPIGSRLDSVHWTAVSYAVLN